MWNKVIELAGRVLARLPEGAARMLCAALGDLLFFSFRRRRWLILSNLHHAFPERTEAWRRRIARESCRRTIELGLFLLVLPWMSEKRLREIVEFPGESRRVLDEFMAAPGGKVLLVPHFTLMETPTVLPLLYPPAKGHGIFYRPLKYQALNRWVKRTRERFGMRMLSRRQGYKEAFGWLRRAGFIGLLFDQSARHQGVLITFFGRVVSATNLPDLMVKKTGSRAALIYPRRAAFWRARIELVPLEKQIESPVWPTLQANAWLEDYLKENDDQCADWLWLHARWKCQHRPRLRLRLEARKNYLEESCRFRGYKTLPRKTRFWLWMPADTGEALKLISYLPDIRRSRPDAEITLVCRDKLRPRAGQFKEADSLVFVPSKGRRAFFRGLGLRYPDVCLLPGGSPEEEREARWTGCPECYTPSNVPGSSSQPAHAYEGFFSNLGLPFSR